MKIVSGLVLTPATSDIFVELMALSLPCKREQLCKQVMAFLMSPPQVVTNSRKVPSSTVNFSSSDIQRNLQYLKIH